MDRRKESRIKGLIKLLFLSIALLVVSCKHMPKPLDIGLEHQVYLAINDSSMQEEVIDQLMTLKQVEGVEAVEVFSRLDVEDERALEYDLLLRVYFKDEKALAQYDSDSLHQSVRNQLKPHLSKPPLTFDLRFQD